MGEYLIVALTVDSAVRKGRGRPVFAWSERAAVLRALRAVDDVVPSESSVQAIRELRPTVFVKGIDYAAGDAWSEDVEAVCRDCGVVLRFTASPKMSATLAILRACL